MRATYTFDDVAFYARSFPIGSVAKLFVQDYRQRVGDILKGKILLYVILRVTYVSQDFGEEIVGIIDTAAGLSSVYDGTLEN